jgi:hypothetical protein
MQHIDWKDPKDVPLDGRPVLLLIEATNRWDEPYLTALAAYFVPAGYTVSGVWVKQINSEPFDGNLKGWVEFEASSGEVGFPAISQHRGTHLCQEPVQECVTVIGPERSRER